MKKLLILLLLTSCLNLDIDQEVDCEQYNNYINALYDAKLEILFSSHPGKYEFKGEIKVIEKERWSRLIECKK